MSESLSDIEVFVACADSGRVNQAAHTLGITPAAASAALKRLEAHLGTRLVLRTTRSLRLSSEGERYLPHARQALASLNEGRLELSRDAHDVRGLVRITAPADFGRNRFAGWLDSFALEFPQVQFQVTLEDAVADFFTAPVDLALRYGELSDSSLIAVPLAQLPRIACASPDYLRRRGEPATPDDLRVHDTICYMMQQRPADRWRFSSAGSSSEVTVTPRWTFNDAEMVRRWAQRGHGIAYRIWADVADDVQAGRLCRVLPQWVGESVPLSLVYAQRRLRPALRTLVEYLQQRSRELQRCHPDTPL